MRRSVGGVRAVGRSPSNGRSGRGRDVGRDGRRTATRGEGWRRVVAVVFVVLLLVVVCIVVCIVVVARDARIDGYDEEDAAGDGDASGEGSGDGEARGEAVFGVVE